MKDWTGNSVAYSKTLGASSHTDHDRATHDYYATEPKTIDLLFEVENFDGNIWECACGEGSLSEAIKNLGYNVYSTDLIDRGYGDGVIDFLSEEKIFWDGNIITNPPYKYANQFITKSLERIPDGKKLALFLPIRYLEGKQRKKIFLDTPPQTVYVSSSRLKCAINGEFDKMQESAVSYAWFVWVKGYKGNTILKWIN